MIIDRERSFNPLQADRVRQFDSAHFGKDGYVKDETGTYIVFEDGSARDLHGDRLDPADVLQPAERRRWQIYWCQKMIAVLSEKFRRQKAIALRTLSDEDRQQLQQLHARIVEIKANLDAIEQETPQQVALARKPTHGVQGDGFRGEHFADGEKHLQDLEEGLRHWQQQREHATDQQAVANAERWIVHCDDKIRNHVRWMNLPFKRRERINESLKRAMQERDRAEYEEYQQRQAEIAALNLAFVEDVDDLQTPEQKRFATEKQHEATLRQETQTWHDTKDQRLQSQRAFNRQAHDDAKAEFDQALQEADEDRAARDKKAKPKAKKAMGRR